MTIGSPMLLCEGPAHAGVAPALRGAGLVLAATPSEQLDLNTATFAELRALPGMGDAYVRRIIEGRPYTAKNQLVTRGILPQAAYERIREAIVAHRPRST